MKTKYVVVQAEESLKIKFCNGYHWQTKTFTNEELDAIFHDPWEQVADPYVVVQATKSVNGEL